MDFDNIGKRIKEIRKEKKFSLEKLSEATGIDTSMLSRYENGKNCKNGMQVYNLVKIANKLETSLDYLVFGKGAKIVSYDNTTLDDFGESFAKSVSFLAKHFSCEIEEFGNDFGGYQDRLLFITSFRNAGFYNLNDCAERIINLYINKNDTNTSSFKKYEKDFLNKIANEINKAKKEDEKINGKL